MSAAERAQRGGGIASGPVHPAGAGVMPWLSEQADRQVRNDAMTWGRAGCAFGGRLRASGTKQCGLGDRFHAILTLAFAAGPLAAVRLLRWPAPPETRYALLGTSSSGTFPMPLPRRRPERRSTTA